MGLAKQTKLSEVQKLSGTITLNAEGEWLHEGVIVTHERTRSLFFKNLYESQGEWFLKGDSVPVPVQIVDTPYFVNALNLTEEGGEITVSDGSVEKLNPATLYFSPDDLPNCLVKDARYTARLTRQVYYQLMQKLETRQGYVGLVLGGVFYPLKRASQDKKRDQKPLQAVNSPRTTAKKSSPLPIKNKKIKNRTPKVVDKKIKLKTAGKARQKSKPANVKPTRSVKKHKKK